MSVQSNKRAASNSLSKMVNEPAKKIIKKVAIKDLTKINLTPISNWMITTAFIESENSSFFVGGDYKPTFLNMQQVLSVGPLVEHVKVGNWIYIDMTRFIKTTKKKSTIRAGIGGEEMVSEQLVPPIFAAPGDQTTYFKINEREIEGVINDPYSMKKEYNTLEAFVKRQEAMEKAAIARKELMDIEARKASLKKHDESKEAKGPMIITETSPNLKN